MTKILFCAIILLVSCSRNQSAASLNPNQTIIDADKSMDWVFGKNFTSWTPEENDIDAAEKLLKDCFDSQKNAAKNRFLNKSLDDYDRQFIGAVNENGDKIIWVNCFCNTQENYFKDWKTKLVFVKDGGNCYFNLIVNITKNTYSDLMINGNG